MTFTQQFTDNFARADSSSFSNGWIDPGSKGSIASAVGIMAQTGTDYNGSGVIYRPTSDGNPRDGQVVITTGTGTSSVGSIYAALRMQTGTANQFTFYGIGFDANAGAFQALAIVNGGISSVAQSAAVTINNAHNYTITASVVGVNPTAIAATLVDNTTSTTVATLSINDSTSALQSPSSGVFGVFANGTAGTTGKITSFTSYSSPSGGTVSIAPNSSAVVYSPGNWDVTSVRALSINAGAYFSTLFTGASVILNFDTTNLATPNSEIYYRIDGYESGSPWTKGTIAGTITPTMPSDTTALPYHLLEVVIKSTSETINRWNSPSATAVLFKGLTLASGSVAIAPGTAPNGGLLVLGDSIAEAVRAVNQTATNDTDRNDAMMGWAFNLRHMLGMEVGVVGFGGSGLTVTGSGNVPVWSTTIQSIMSGVARSTSITNLKAILINLGTNDSGASSASVTAGMTALLNNALSMYSGVPIIVMRPFNGSQASALQAGIAASSNPSLIKWMDTTGFFNTSYGADSLNLHPSGPNNLGIIAPKVAASLKTLMPTGRSYSFS